METSIEVTPFINNRGELAYEIALDDGLDTRLLEVTAEEVIFLGNVIADLDHDRERERLE